GVCTKEEWADEAGYKRFQQTCTAVRKLLEKSPLRRQLQEEHLLEAAATGLDLLHVVADAASCYEAAKQDQNVLEFDDLLVRAHRLLTDPAHRGLRKSLVGNTRLLMVDEFQDTDPLQVAIVKAFCGDDWARQGLFVVGDHKQSIYRFRGAEPRVSSELRASLPAENRLSLTTNFRSQPAILDFVNGLFHGTFAENYEPLRPSRPQATPTPAVEFVWAVGEGDPDDQSSSRHGPKQRARTREARFIARRLAQLIDSGEPIVSDSGRNGEPGEIGEPPRLRPLELGDIAILMRSLSDVPIYEDALRQHGLDYYLAGGHAFYAQQEIYDVLHLLRAIASPADELSLAGALRSPIFALQDETLYWLVEQHGSLNAGLLAEELPSQLSPDERTKLQRAAATLRRLRAGKDRLLVAQLLNLAWELTGYDAALLCEFLGERKLANVRKLVEQARAIDRTRPGDLVGFITQLSEFVVRAPKEPLAATRAEGNVIRIMTIHNAKGLEFPLVVVPDLDRKTRSEASNPVFDERLGPLVPAAAEKATVGLDLYRSTQRDEDLEERKRLLYVACTRAADYLILSSSVDDLDKPRSDWLRLLAERFDLHNGECLAKLPDDYGLPQVRVIAEEPEIERKLSGKSYGADLAKLAEKTRQLAAAGKGEVPESVGPIPADAGARRRFSFSRLSGQL
ncbi:MAG: UvrD-helicase domain-containing protein, partial [Planctomycetes bacterium]|nr:UvrD-helicase domain-containing protein [Planctomycetota bacterium]